MSTDYSADSTLILISPSAAILSFAVFQISSGIRGRPAENGIGSNRMEKVPSSKSGMSAKVQIEGATLMIKLGMHGELPRARAAIYLESEKYYLQI